MLDSLIVGLAWFLNIYYFIRQQVWCRLWCSRREWVDLLGCLFDEVLFISTKANPRWETELLRDWHCMQLCCGNIWIRSIQFHFGILHSGERWLWWLFVVWDPPPPLPLFWTWSQRQIIRWVRGSNISSSAVKLGVLPHSSTHKLTQTHTGKHTHVHTLQVCHKLGTWVTV